ncbi:PRC-barrel domain protein [Clostridium acetireducens DSM 10703]|jgi:sporulation protein YlmC with PRC-barrel domain|uniref:PRC-barrel domain protein n=1 Tax=Clostridium acetireducens DSM 10703 TaxID=1121290 RepID=A0A1E8EWV2_9CLOT|nr:PRC-barrel domain-containing protein [Clostridium acetireducens]OFI05080.1 PRC-barrel domain protein [Clostridium acetireducens DSM 10703]
MKKLSSLFLSQILNKKVYDEFGEPIGKLVDMYVTSEENYPKIIGYKIKRRGDIFNYEFKNIDFFEEKGNIIIKVNRVRGIIPRTYSYLLSKHLLNKQIVDINNKKIIKVNDVRIAQIAGELKVIAIDTGVLALCRRFGIEKIATPIYNLLNKNYSNTIVVWDDLGSPEIVNNNLKNSIK